MTLNLRATLPLVAVAAAAVAGLAAPEVASASTKLHCTAVASPSHPKQNSNVRINVKANAGRASVHAIAHYKSTNTGHYAKTNRRGAASVVYDISRATVGYKVKVNVTVTTAHKKAACSTAFTPTR